MLFFVVCHNKPTGIQRFEYECESLKDLKVQLYNQFRDKDYKIDVMEYYDMGRILDVYFSKKIF